MADVSVRVFVRFRPRNKVEKKSKSYKKVDFKLDVQERVISYKKLSNKTLHFTFDDVLGETVDQEDTFWRVAEPVCNDVLQGYNGTIFVYGQTGSGKTYIQFGPEEVYKKGSSFQDHSTLGLIPRCVPYLLSKIKENTELNQEESKIEAQVLEIYFEKFKDLLNPNGPELRVVGTEIPYLTKVPIKCLTDTFKMIRKAMHNRVTTYTKMNAASSRSHAIVILSVTQSYHNGTTKTGKVNFADLAGSEKISKSGVKGLKLDQAKAINLSLTNLGIVINALAERKPFIPYRNSSLTWFLKDSLCGNFKTTLVVAGSLAPYNLVETVNSLRFGQRCKLLKTRVKVNKVLSRSALKKRIKYLNWQVAELEKENKKLLSRLEESDRATLPSDDDRDLNTEINTIGRGSELSVLETSPSHGNELLTQSLQNTKNKFAQKTQKYKARIKKQEIKISKMKDGLTELWTEYNEQKKQLEATKSRLENSELQNTALEAQLAETLESYTNLKASFDLLQEEVHQEKIHLQSKSNLISLLTNKGNTFKNGTCLSCQVLYDEKLELEKERDNLQAMVSAYRTLEEENQKAAKADDEALEDLLKQQEEYITSVLSTRSNVRLKERAEGEDHFKSGVVKSSSSDDAMMQLFLLNAEAERDT